MPKTRLRNYFEVFVVSRQELILQRVSGYKPEITEGENSIVYRVRISKYEDTSKQTISITGKHRVKIGSRSQFYC